MNRHSTTMCIIPLFCGELPKTLSCLDAGLDLHMPPYIGLVVGGRGLLPSISLHENHNLLECQLSWRF